MNVTWPPAPDISRNLRARASVFHAVRGKLSPLVEFAERLDEFKAALAELASSATQCGLTVDDDAAAIKEVIRAFDTKRRAMQTLAVLDVVAKQFIGQLLEMLETACGEDPFAAVCDRIEEQAQALYGEAWRPVALSIVHTRSHPRGDGHRDPYTVSAVTKWRAEVADVELQIYVDKFGPAAFAAIPLILTHECVCHVPARQDKANNSSTFAEGLLDWASWYFHDNWAAKLDPVFAPAARKHADELKHVLMDGETAEAAARISGHDAAADLTGWMETQFDITVSEARSRIAQLAVELNQLDRPIGDKDHFVSLLRTPFHPRLETLLIGWYERTTTAAALLDDTRTALT